MANVFLALLEEDRTVQKTELSRKMKIVAHRGPHKNAFRFSYPFGLSLAISAHQTEALGRWALIRLGSEK
jgi:hypothetical protein